MDDLIKLWLFFGGFVLFLVILGFVMFWVIRKIHLKQLKKIRCEIFLPSGDRITVNRQMDEKSFVHVSSEGKKGRYFIIKEAIRKDIEKKLFKTKVSFILQFIENISLPFINEFDGKTFNKKFLGAERAEQMYIEKIWDRVGGLGETNMKSIMMIVAVIIVIIVIIGIVIMVVK